MLCCASSAAASRTERSMQIEPPAQAFAERYARGEPQVVWTTLVADLETPVSAFLKVAGDRPMSFLLESVEGGAVRGRYSIIGLDPDVIWRARGPRAEINRTARAQADAFMACPQPPLDALRALIAESRIVLPDRLPPMAAGVFGYLGYDMVRLMEELDAPKADPIGVPDAVLVRPTLVIVFDSVEDTLPGVTPVGPDLGVCASAALARAGERLSSIVEALDRPLDKESAGTEAGPLSVPPTSNTTPAEYQRMVLRAKDYIAAGDIFQVVLSQRFEAPFALPPFALYRALRRVNPAPFLYFLDFDGFCVAGSSPEILVRVRNGVVTIRPIAGTRPRGPTPHEDKALEDELLADPKERAEHLMLLDLGRNDVGRVAEIGTVRVTDQFFVERYSHVMHIVSNVEGKLAAPHAALDALAAGFIGRAEGARDADHRRAGEGEARALRRMRRLFLGRRRDGHMHRAAHGARQGWRHVRAGRRRNRCRFRSRVRAGGMRQQGQGAVPRRRGSAPLRERRAARPVASLTPPGAASKTLSGQENPTNHDHIDRQLRQLHL
jgi:anthranilate synthase component 1